MIMSRRGLLIGGGAAIAAPAIVRVDSLMKVWAILGPRAPSMGDTVNIGFCAGRVVGRAIDYMPNSKLVNMDRLYVAGTYYDVETGHPDHWMVSMERSDFSASMRDKRWRNPDGGNYWNARDAPHNWNIRLPDASGLTNVVYGPIRGYRRGGEAT